MIKITRKEAGLVCAGIVLCGCAGRAAVTPNLFTEGSDSDRIEAAVAMAIETGERSVEIPRMNAKSGEPIWLIDRAILVPSDFTLILRDCLVRLAPGTQDNIIRNAGTAKEPMAADRNIRVLGIGNAVLSGGLTAHFDPPGDRGGWRTIGVLLCNVKGFTLDGFTVEESQAWGISVEHGCTHGRISNIAFNNTGKIPNQDGVDVRKGCHNISIENITGRVGDDAVALTGLRRAKGTPPSPTHRAMEISGSEATDNDDITNITIRNVQATCMGSHGIIRLLNQDGVKMYNIIVRDIIDTSAAGEPRVQAAVRIGDARFWTIRKSELGEMFNIVVDNVMTRGRAGVTINGPLKDSTIRNIIGFDGCTNRVQKAAQMENVVF